MAADIVYDTVALPPAFLGVAYEAAVGYHGAASALTAASATGLPTGLSLVHSTFAESCSVRITGTPTAAGANAAVVITLTDSAGAAESGDYSITVYGAPNDMSYLESLASTGAEVAQINL
jgi:hypothetical protein